MRKTDKKIDNKLREVLTDVCDFALQEVAGYQWISHTVNYNSFPDSLVITCMFDNKQSADTEKQQGELLALINEKLNAVAISLKNPNKQISFEAQ
ncbi:Fis family transcriptional regulator [Psychromonas sp. Urea-02u-13]|uniref:Fis family transcriptional regulator n=1 Tax=Psychromonas sp. Urea-02u-13 TaxID=2058326 RepID=UPI000C32E9C5|nr:Fis family transcriptional regulator [Psychromonas sp. Urea-02u-13]PKG40920.1 Fis family transcriptional regulator [Psychromonas sp. Urea-02u-13]